MKERVVHVRIPSGLILTSNQRLHWAVKSRRTHDIRLLGKYAAAKVSPRKPMERVTLDILIGLPDKRQRDTENFAPTWKALVDGCRDAGLVIEDHSGVITSTTYRSEVTAARGGFDFTLTFTEAS